jgi:hypothetical protein
MYSVLRYGMQLRARSMQQARGQISPFSTRPTQTQGGGYAYSTGACMILYMLYAVREREAAYAIHSEQRLQAKEEEYRTKYNAVILPRSPVLKLKLMREPMSFPWCGIVRGRPIYASSYPAALAPQRSTRIFLYAHFVILKIIDVHRRSPILRIVFNRCGLAVGSAISAMYREATIGRRKSLLRLHPTAIQLHKTPVIPS